jgi:hypothetical protein
MGDFPIQAILVPAVGLAFVVFFLVNRKRMLAKHDATYAQYRVGEMANRLGLTLVEGDPTFNLFIQQAHVDIQRGPADGRPVHIQVRMTGEPGGRPLEFFYMYRLEQETGMGSVVWRTWTECRMTATPQKPFPPFEVVSKKAPLGPIATVLALAPVPTGNAQVDATHSVMTQEPAMAKLLGEVVPGFHVFENGSGIHLVGDGQRVSFRMQRDKAPLLANAMYYAENMATLLSDLAKRVGG